ncbi:hypothetical protein L249_8190 [Ophiocordyceps polyrhachis-furcata BCC 54312]|uniref:Uncharacterized protein n=1 Tax=Ophiocordyceps polyrhachis-furcata BCC 54312 TaxID=1330021 RepID=A0A367LHY6_9HYPO|nr:hypothetical protein L249_8190 [Ophiocordyceps polyrhachis-furcata BCC 54312]
MAQQYSLPMRGSMLAKSLLQNALENKIPKGFIIRRQQPTKGTAPVVPIKRLHTAMRLHCKTGLAPPPYQVHVSSPYWVGKGRTNGPIAAEFRRAEVGYSDNQGGKVLERRTLRAEARKKGQKPEFEAPPPSICCQSRRKIRLLFPTALVEKSKRPNNNIHMTAAVAASHSSGHLDRTTMASQQIFSASLGNFNGSGPNDRRPLWEIRMILFGTDSDGRLPMEMEEMGINSRCTRASPGRAATLGGGGEGSAAAAQREVLFLPGLKMSSPVYGEEKTLEQFNEPGR